MCCTTSTPSQALARGCHVLVEKPLTTTAADARDLMLKADAAGRQVIVPTGWNFKTWTDKARALVAAGEIGRIEHIVLQMASALEDLFAGQPMKETEGADVSPSALDLGRSQAGRGLWLGATRACAGAIVPHRRSQAVPCVRR